VTLLSTRSSRRALCRKHANARVALSGWSAKTIALKVRSWRPSTAGSLARGWTSPDACQPSPHSHAPGMFVITEAEAAAIRTAFDRGGEFAAAVELRRLFPGVTDTAKVRDCAHHRRLEATACEVPAG
jgi:hypothetical protein